MNRMMSALGSNSSNGWKSITRTFFFCTIYTEERVIDNDTYAKYLSTFGNFTLRCVQSQPIAWKCFSYTKFSSRHMRNVFTPHSSMKHKLAECGALMKPSSRILCSHAVEMVLPSGCINHDNRAFCRRGCLCLSTPTPARATQFCQLRHTVH